MRKKIGLCVAMVLTFALMGSGALPKLAQIIAKGSEVVTMKQQTQSDFIYKETFENNDFTDVRYRAKIDLNWKFIQEDVPGAEAKDFDDSSWRLLNLPHDWSIEGEYNSANPCGGSGGYLPTGIGWYRKTITVPAEWKDGRRVSLLFDGVFCNSTVYVDGEKVGGREYGWLSFSCDITEQVEGKESVVIAVRVDNSVQPAARWYTGSGIYSHVWILSTENIHIAENGTYITTLGDADGIPTGDMNLQTSVENDGTVDVNVSVRSTVYKKSDNAQVAQVTSAPVLLSSEDEITVSQTATVTDLLLWNTESPNLYYVETEILSDGEVIDDYITEFGFRVITYDINGLYLNGENIELKGVANHWALGALGAAQSTNMIRYKIQMMKDMGVNCIRTAHNACPPEFYQLCNEMGMMVLDELFEGEKGKEDGDYGTRWFTELWQKDTEYWVKRDRNHPSVVVWSIGNETGSSNDNTGISAYIKNFDTTRPTTGSAIHTGVDIPGANGQSEPASFTQPVSTLPLIATEAPHTHAVRGVYRTQTWFRGKLVETYSGNTIPNLTDSEIFKYDWSSSAVGARTWASDYDNATSQISVRGHWIKTRDTDWRIGEFRWTGFDYLGEANYVLGGWPYRMFHSGAVDTALFEKGMYYLYQSMWTDEPMLHILPSWTHPTFDENTTVPVWVYSNCEKVELFLNGVSYGIVDRGPVHLRDENSIQFSWDVPYTPGTLTAVGYDADGNEILRDSYTTASAPAALTLENTTGEEFPKDPSWVGQVTVSSVDKDGNFYPYGENRTYYYVSGPAYIKAADNGSPTDTESHVNYNRNAFMGLSKVFVCPTQDEGDILFTSAAVLGEKRQLTSDLVYIDVQQLALRGNPAKQNFEIYYTVDGSTPTKSSQRYTGAFSVELGTTVKTVVYVEGSDIPMFYMEESFGENEGMYWAGTGTSQADNVYSAKDAVITGDQIRKVDYGYEEQYVDFNGAAGSAEYTVTAPTAGEYYLAVCYNNGSGSSGSYKTVEVLANGVSTGSHKFYYNGTWGTFWSYRMVKVSLMEGENKIKFHCPSVAGPNLKQLILLFGEDVYTAVEAHLPNTDGNDKVSDYETSFDGKGIDVGSNGGSVQWTVSDKPAGTYKVSFFYSTPNSSLREVSLSVNGTVISYFSGKKVSPNYGSSWGYEETEVYLAPGINTITTTAPTGGALFGGIALTPVLLTSPETTLIDASCVEDTRLVGGTSPSVSGTDTISADAVWDIYTRPDGMVYLVNRADGRLLASDGISISLAEGETEKNAAWMRVSETEHYDYLKHANSGKIIALSPEGTLFLDDDSNYLPGNLNTNRAYWYLHEFIGADFAFASDTPVKKTVGDKPFFVTASGSAEGEVTYAVVSGPATVDFSGIVTLTGQPGTVVLKATLTQDGVPVASVTHTVLVLSSSVVADAPGITLLPGDGSSANGATMATTHGVPYWNFGNGGDGRSVTFTVNAETEGEYYLAICYNSKNARTLLVTANGTSQTVSVAKNSNSWGDSTTATDIVWSYHVITVILEKGQNTLTVGMNGTNPAPMFSDLMLWPKDEWLTVSDNPTLTGASVPLTGMPFAFDGTVFNVGNNPGTVTWYVTVPVSGTYTAKIPYSGLNSSAPISLSVGGQTVATIGTRTTSGGYDAAMKFVTTEAFHLAAGQNVPVTLSWSGGAYLSGVRLELTEKDPGVVDINVSWADMHFTYNKGDWNVQTHQYENSGWVPSSGNSAVTVSNVGNTNITATLGYTPKSGKEDYTVTVLLNGAEGVFAQLWPGNEAVYSVLLTSPAPSTEMTALPVGTLTLGIKSEN